MQRETIPPVMAFLRTTITSALIFLIGASATAHISVHRASNSLSVFSRFLSARQQKKRILTLRRSEMANGSRFMFISDSSLDDYSSYAEGERFFIRIPQAILTSAQNNLEGRGFIEMRVEQREDDVFLSFRLQTGATVAINQSFNQLETLFFTNERANKSSSISKGHSKQNQTGYRQD